MQKTRIVQIRSKLANFHNFLRLVWQDGEQMSGKKATQGFFTLFTGVVQKSFVKLVFKLFFEMFLFNVLFKPCIILECKNLPQNEGYAECHSRSEHSLLLRTLVEIVKLSLMWNIMAVI